jgi:hypothetical protein
MKRSAYNLIDSLQKMPQSKDQRLSILKSIDNGSISIADLIDIYHDQDLFVCQKASWLMQIIALHRPQLLRPYEKDLIDGLKSAPHDAYLRNTIRIFQDMDVLEDLEGVLYDYCFNFLTSFQAPTAVKAFSMTVLRKTAVKHPDLIDELILAIEEQMEIGTTGFNNRAAKELLILHKKKG